jgi:hypothetical protein
VRDANNVAFPTKLTLVLAVRDSGRGQNQVLLNVREKLSGPNFRNKMTSRGLESTGTSVIAGLRKKSH